MKGYVYVFILGDARGKYFNMVQVAADGIDQATNYITDRDGIMWDEVTILNVYRIEHGVLVHVI